MIKEVFRNGVISAARLKMMQSCSELKEIDRSTLCSMVKKVSVLENRRLEIEFYYRNQYHIMQEANQRLQELREKQPTGAYGSACMSSK